MVSVYEEERRRVLEVLEGAREEQVRGGLQAAKNGEGLPRPKGLKTLCANTLKAEEEDGARFWEGRKQRLNDTVKALGLVDCGSGKPATPFKGLATPSKPTAPSKATPAKPTPAPTPKRKIPPTPNPTAKKTIPAEPTAPRSAPADIKTSQWNNRAMRFLMAQSANGHDISKDYIMPPALPPNTFKRRK